MVHPLRAASALVLGRPLTLIPLVLVWAETFVSLPMAAGLRGSLRSFHFTRQPTAFILEDWSPEAMWVIRALESGGAAMLPSTRSGWVSFLIPALALVALGVLAFGKRARELDPDERSLLRALSVTGLMAAVGNVLGQAVWSRASLGGGGWTLFQMGGAALRAVVVPATFGTVLLWLVVAPVARDRPRALARLSLMTLIAAAMLGLPSVLREGIVHGYPKDFERGWATAMPLIGMAAALLAAWALRPTNVLRWLEQPLVLMALVASAVLQFGGSVLRGAMPPVETLRVLDATNRWSGQLSLPGFGLNALIAAAQIALACIVIAALATSIRERRT